MKLSTKINLYFIPLALLSLKGFSQGKQCEVTDAVGFGETVPAAHHSAINNAYDRLITKCGAGIRISSSTLDISESTEELNKSSSFNSLLTGLEGIVSNFSVVSADTSIVDGGYVKVQISARAKIYSEKVISNILDISGILPQYKMGDLLEFRVNSNEDVYLNIYQVRNETANLFLPKKGEVDEIKLNSGKTIYFPQGIKEGMKLRAHLDSFDEEIVRLIFIASKRKTEWDSELSLSQLVQRYTSMKGIKDIKLLNVAIVR